MMMAVFLLRLVDFRLYLGEVGRGDAASPPFECCKMPRVLTDTGATAALVLLQLRGNGPGINRYGKNGESNGRTVRYGAWA